METWKSEYLALGNFSILEVALFVSWIANLSESLIAENGIF